MADSLTPFPIFREIWLQQSSRDNDHWEPYFRNRPSYRGVCSSMISMKMAKEELTARIPTAVCLSISGHRIELTTQPNGNFQLTIKYWWLNSLADELEDFAICLRFGVHIPMPSTPKPSPNGVKPTPLEILEPLLQSA